MYTPLAIHSLGGVQAVLLIKTKLLTKVEGVHVSDVACGVGNVLHNKGGIGVWLKLEGKSFLFVTSHLAAHEDKVDERNGDYKRIVEELEEDMPGFVKRKRGKSLVDSVDHVVWCGDLNYRLGIDRATVDDVVKLYLGAGEDGGRRRRRKTGKLKGVDAKEPWPYLLKYDQLRVNMKRKRAFVGLTEAPITFPPTYKFDKGERGLRYDTSVKRRVPSWTDRVLYKDGSGVECLKYGADFKHLFSDHRPVFCVLRVNKS